MSDAADPLSRLSARHLADLRASGLSDDTIRAARVYTNADSESVASLIGWQHGAGKLGPCMVIPYRGPTGEFVPFHRLKPDNPRADGARVVKYESPVGRPLRVYFTEAAVAALNDPTAEVVGTEGEKKAMAGGQAGIPTVGIGGCWAWGKRDAAGNLGLVDDLNYLPVAGRTIVLAPDSDAVENGDVATGFYKLGELLAARGAKVVQVAIPPAPDGSKQGLDDFLIREGRPGWDRLRAAAAAPLTGDPPGVLRNYAERTGPDGKTVRVGRHLELIRRRAAALGGGWPRRVGPCLFVPGAGFTPHWLDAPDKYFAWLATTSGAAVAANTSDWREGAALATKKEFYAYLQQTLPNYAAVELSPHEPPMADTYYLHPPVTGGGGKALAGFLALFRPASAVDRDLLTAYLLTLAWGGPPGRRPAFMFSGADGDARAGRGCGKTAAATYGAALFGGYTSIETTDDIGRIKSRLLAADAAGRRVVLIDNIKTAKFSWGDLESLITETQINGHRMYVGDAARPNTLTTAITLNGASLSKDLAQRFVNTRLARPDYSPDWTDRVDEYIRANRWAIVGDLLATLRRPGKPLGPASRWGQWERDVLSRVGDPVACQAAIAQRAEELDEDAEDADRVRTVIGDVLRAAGRDPDREAVAIESSAVVEIVSRARGERVSATGASTFLKSIAVPELRKGSVSGMKLWFWHGPNSGPVTRFDRVRYAAEGRRFMVGDEIPL